MTEENKQLTHYLLPYNLQFFASDGDAGDKTEDATPKKLGKARDEGQVAKSKDLNTAISIMAIFILLKFTSGFLYKKFVESFISTYENIDLVSGDEMSNNLLLVQIGDMLKSILIATLPVMIVSVVVAFITDIVQVKWKLTTKPLKPKFSKFNPVNGFKNMFSKAKLVELFINIAKIIVISYLSYDTLKDEWDTLLILYDLPFVQAIVLIGDIVINLGIRISILLLIIGFVDLFYQKHKFKKDMKMTKQEVKDEYKQSEGNPEIKGKIKRRMREASQRRMMQSVPEADVVITNPTHFAAAIKYDKEKAEAPILLAKGADYVAQKIKEIARENQVEIVENKPLARMLYYNVEVGNEIPPELYQMTAEVLAYVYGLKNKS